MKVEEPTPGEEAIIDGLRSIFRLLDERLPKEEPAWKRDGIIPTLQGSARAKEAEQVDDATNARYEREDAEARQDEPVEPGDLRAGDRVAFMWGATGERIACTLEGHQDGNVLRSGTPDRDGFYPNVTLHGREWCVGISDVRLIERAPREKGLDAAVWHRQFEKEKARAEEAERRVDELEPALARSETERDEWKARYKALRGDVYLLSIRATTALETRPKLRAILDRDAERGE